MNKEKAILVAAALFASYPTVNEFHVTTDEQAFEQKHDAEAHASFLDKKQPVVFTVTREEADNIKTDDGAAEAAIKKVEKKVAGLKTAYEKTVTAHTNAKEGKKAETEQKMNDAKSALETAEQELADLTAQA